MPASSKLLPGLPIPAAVSSTEPGTWAYDTMTRRLNDEILERTYKDNKETWESAMFAPALTRIQALRYDLQNAKTCKVTHLDDLPEGESAAVKKEWTEWHEILEPYVENEDTFLTVAPWMVAEMYVYRRLIQALGYFDPNSPGYMYDPFVKAKREGLQSSISSAEQMLAKTSLLPATSKSIKIATNISLWANKLDLSVKPANDSESTDDLVSMTLHMADENLLHDDSDVLVKHCEKLRADGGGYVDIIVDNAGFELIADFALAQHLVETGIAKVVTFQLKSYPVIVSDALEKDLLEHVERFVQLDVSQYPAARAAGIQWKEYLTVGKWKCHEDAFWVQPYAMWDMTEPLRTDMATRCDLAFVKGDANYRKLLGDRRWALTAPFEDVVGCYFPCPVCALRTLKSDLGCGMAKDQIERAMKLDDEWMIDGKFGVIHLGNGSDEYTNASRNTSF
jgi:hypothetical protein